jgi:hypothetical protein
LYFTSARRRRCQILAAPYTFERDKSKTFASLSVVGDNFSNAAKTWVSRLTTPVKSITGPAMTPCERCQVHRRERRLFNRLILPELR